jgi:hypothetical protein
MAQGTEEIEEGGGFRQRELRNPLWELARFTLLYNDLGQD